MITDTLQKIRNYIAANGLDAGYQIGYFMLDDSRDAGVPVMIIRISGNGTNKVYMDKEQPSYEGIDAEIQLIDVRANTKAMYDRLSDIRAIFTKHDPSSGFVGSRVLSNISQPAIMDDDRVMIRFILRVNES